MAEEQIEDNVPQSAPGSMPPPASTPIPPASVQAPTSAVQCEECKNSINPNFIFTDSKTGKHYCNACTKACENCEEEHPKIDMMKDPHGGSYSTEWYCEDCYNELYATCPNCNEVVSVDNIIPPNNRNRWNMRNGGCTECAIKCYSCDKCVDKEEANHGDGDDYCEDCFSENYSSCDECGNTIDNDSAEYVNESGPYCERCRNKLYVVCHKCDKEIERSDSTEIDNEEYCEDCAQNMGPGEYVKYTENFKNFSYTKKDRHLNLLAKLLPISVKDLKSKHPSIANALNDLIVFSKGKPLTQELIQEYRASLNPEEFPVGYTGWSGVQRSISNANIKDLPYSQLVLNIVASDVLVDKLKNTSGLSYLFNMTNRISEDAHPFVNEQIGWVRLELDPNGEYILVDELQCDHSNVAFQLKAAVEYEKYEAHVDNIKKNYNLGNIPESQFDRYLDDILMDWQRQDDEDVKAIRAIYKRKFQRTDEELNKVLTAKKIKPKLEDKLNSKFEWMKDLSWRKYMTLMLSAEQQKDPDVIALRNIYKLFGKLDDKQLDRMLTRNEMPDIPRLSSTRSEIKRIETTAKSKFLLDDTAYNNLLNEYAAALNDFPNIATQAVSNFARKNGFKKIFWHTYESGMELKNNAPPKSLYDKTPKENFFKPSEEKPFGLNGEFFEREAKAVQNIYKLARRLYLKYI